MVCGRALEVYNRNNYVFALTTPPPDLPPGRAGGRPRGDYPPGPAAGGGGGDFVE